MKWRKMLSNGPFYRSPPPNCGRALLNGLQPVRLARAGRPKPIEYGGCPMRKAVLAVLSCLVIWNPVMAQTCRKQSPAHTVALLELYTSEGCSSCPPADRAIAGLRAAAQNDQVVPLALHVDYWDYIGWTDRFAKPEFTQRQY